jgi:acetyltransferase-like isoleucine patch superfamily enzyme
MILRLLLIFLPWSMRRRLLKWLFGYDLHPTSRIGKSWVYPRHLKLEENAVVGHLNLIKGLDRLELGRHSSIGHMNWITAHPSGGLHFRHVEDRSPSLIIGDHSAITSHHFMDCASRIIIGDYSTVAGIHSQFFTHNLDIENCRQDTRPIEIGSYCLVATGTVILAGSVLPDYSVLSAMSLLNKRHSETHRLYAGVPASPLKAIPAESRYFARTEGFIE